MVKIGIPMVLGPAQTVLLLVRATYEEVANDEKSIDRRWRWGERMLLGYKQVRSGALLLTWRQEGYAHDFRHLPFSLKYRSMCLPLVYSILVFLYTFKLHCIQLAVRIFIDNKMIFEALTWRRVNPDITHPHIRMCVYSRHTNLTNLCLCIYETCISSHD